MDVVGFSNATLCDFLVSLSRRAPNSAALLASLTGEAGLAPSDALTRLASELHERIPKANAGAAAAAASSAAGHKRKEAPGAAAAAAHKQALAEARRAASFALVDEDDDAAMAPIRAPKAKPSKEERKAAKMMKKEKKAERRARKAARDSSSDSSSDSDADDSRRRRNDTSAAGSAAAASSASTAAASSSAAAAAASSSPSAELSEAELAEIAREQDQAEKRAFEQRLADREAERTKQLAGGSKDADKRKKSAALSDEEMRALIPQIREQARAEYLRRREAQQIELLRRSVKDEESMFGGANEKQLTASERAQLHKRRRVLELTTERKALSEAGDAPAYHMPSSGLTDAGKIDSARKMELLSKRYVDEQKPVSEQAQWEEHQSRAALMKFGAADAAAAGGGQVGGGAQQYDLVFDEEEEAEQIEFVKQDMIAALNINDTPPDAAAEEAAAAASVQLSEWEQIQVQRKKLPIYPMKEELMAAIEKYQVLIVVAETGSGKTTQLTQYLVEAGYAKKGRIGCTQPRRVAAMSVAARVAQEMNVKLGAEVGYTVRFEDCSSDRTIVKYMTDGMLLREFLGEPDLKSYSVMIIDEAHERTLSTDVLFGLVKDIARYRPDIKILISSATLDADKFSRYWDDAPVFVVPGRRYPVNIYYTKAPEADYLDACIVTVLQIHTTQPPGDILVFLTGQEEIETASEILSQRLRGLGTKVGEMLVLPIYSTLPTEQQAKIFEPTPPGARKVVLATNIAETSLTINGIIYVIDPGFSKQKSYNPRTGMESLVVTPVARSSARQRAGRAGRVAPGSCFRMYTAHAFAHELEENTVPEIQRTNLGNVVLMLKSLGINDLIHFDFMDPPPAETLIRALEQLYALGALNDRGELTKLGRRMAELPLDPQLSKTLIHAEKYGVTSEVLTICAMLSCQNTIFYRPKDKAVHADTAHKNFWQKSGDMLTLLNVYNQWAASDFSAEWCFENFIQMRSLKRCRDIREQLENMLSRVEVQMAPEAQPGGFDELKVRKALCAGFFFHAAKLEKSGSYLTLKHRQQVHLHPFSCLAQELPRFVLYFELVFTSKAFMRQVIEIDPAWLVEVAPHYYNKKDTEDQSKIKMPKNKGKAAELPPS